MNKKKEQNLSDLKTNINYNPNEDNNISFNQLNPNNDITLHDSRINYYTKCLCKIEATPLNQIEQRIFENKKKLFYIDKDLKENPDKYNSGKYFIVFKNTIC